MLTEVKVPEVPYSRAYSGLVQKALSAFWLGYFLLTISIVGGIFAYGISIPLFLVGRVYRPFWKMGGEVLRFGVDLLMKCQPWVEIEADFSLPKNQNFVTFSNHRSHLDMFILLTRIPNIRVIAKSALFKVPFLGVMLRVMKDIPLRKNSPESYRKAFDLALRASQEGDPVHFFPEMTRCNDFSPPISPFHLSPFQTMLNANVPIYPIVFWGSDEAWGKRGGLRFGKKIRVKLLPPLDPSEYKTAIDLKMVAQEKILSAIESLR